MEFISPKTDFAFKKIFGSVESKNILISFLNAILYQERKVIQDLEIIDPYNPAALETLKDTYVDVRAILDNKVKIILEMQVLNITAFHERVIYKLAQTYSSPRYSQSSPVISITITDFLVFPETEKVITYWGFLEEKSSISYGEEMEMVFIELPKFNKKLEELETITDKWLYLLKESEKLENIPETIKEIPEINQALTISNKASLSSAELEELQKREIFLQEEKANIAQGKQPEWMITLTS